MKKHTTPTVSDMTVTPTSLPYGGGNIVVNATITNASRVEVNGVTTALPATMRVTVSGNIVVTALNQWGQASSWMTVMVAAAPPTPPSPTPNVPTISNFTATPSSVLGSGENVTFNAAVTDATTMTLNGTPIVALPVVRAVSGTPGTSQTFTLVATNATGAANATVAVVLTGIVTPPSSGVVFGSGAATVTLPDNSAATVLAALAAAVPGDVIQLQPGITGWSSRIEAILPADVTLRGAGWNGVDGGGDATTIVDDYVGSQYLLSLYTPGRLRISGITFKGGAGSFKDNGAIGLFALAGKTAEVRLDHQHWNMRTGNWSNMKLMSIGAGVRGVGDSNILDMKELSWIHVVNGRSQGDTEWALATAFGTNDFFFFEDNQVTGMTAGTVYNSALMDCHTGGKFVIRFNTLVECAVSQTHPTGHAGDDRGARAHENYCNLVTSSLAKDPNFAMDYNNSGGAMVWGNSANNVYKNMLYLNNCRNGPGGSNCGYSQVAPPNGWGYPGTTYGPSNWDQNSNAAGSAAIDQPGRGKGQLLAGSFPNKRNVITGTIAWPNQVLDPIYYWDNAGSIVAGWGGSFMANLAGGLLQANRDYYMATSPFNGSSGCGSGTMANRPSSGLTPGVGYFATDQGSWNTRSNVKGVQRNGVSGVLYVATGPTTWTPYYTPYTYPHPMRSAA